MALLWDMIKTSVVGVPGAGSITIGAPITGFMDFLTAGVPNGTLLSYGAGDGLVNGSYTVWEVGRGTYSGGVLTRGPVFSSNSNSAVNLGATAVVWATPIAGDLLTTTINSASKTVNYSVLAADSSLHFDDIGSGGAIMFTLPAAAAGLTYTFTALTANHPFVLASGTDVIYVGTSVSSAGGRITAGGLGSSVTLEAHGSGVWFATAVTGTWTPS